MKEVVQQSGITYVTESLSATDKNEKLRRDV